MEEQPNSLRVAVATKGDKGLEDTVSHEFGHAKTFTIIDIQDGMVKNLEVIENPAASLSHGKGPVIAKYLADMKVNMVISGEVGPGASTMLNELKIKILAAKSGEQVIKVLKINSLIK
ncbi:MAG: NifB/NifX family molybdenum-iron cluster-binding protein [Candidatus Bathyarchaeota archaeon]|jgi:predicted Fe-Mo cluster-binding NifX family protein|nr:NifB/NifX family molybdenum-iron cluster-binding protein [Candidatus Bathyarchaeota archaeon]